MKLLEDDVPIGEFREALMQFLNDFGLVAPAILSLVRRTELVKYEPGEYIMEQQQDYENIFFLVDGRIEISIQSQDRVEVVGERGPVTLLGEISYFNKVPATATVKVPGEEGCHVLQISYDRFSQVIDEYPQIKTTLARIGDMRVISQKDGFSDYSFFMDMIGWKRNRLVPNRALLEHLEETLHQVLLPILNDEDKLLDVGDGPGIVCEIILEKYPEKVDKLFIQATHLEDAILNPNFSYPSDFSRTKYLREKFQAITALQIFEHLPPDQISSQFEEASRLLAANGKLLVIRLRVVDVVPASGRVDTTLIFDDLSRLVEKNWPGQMSNPDLVKITFVDADIDPMMEWNPEFCELATGDKLPPLPSGDTIDGALLGILIDQATRGVFEPEELQFHLLVWHASRHGFHLESFQKRPEVGFYYQLFRKGKASPKRI